MIRTEVIISDNSGIKCLLDKIGHQTSKEGLSPITNTINGVYGEDCE